MMRKNRLIVLSIFGVLIMLFGVPWLLMYIGMRSIPDPPKPEITYGEFPFRLEYEIDGQIVVVEDTLVCEYDGINADTGRGKFRCWKSHLASGKDEIVLLKVANPAKTWMGTPQSQIIYYYPGAASYYMGDVGDMGESASYTHDFPNAMVCEEYAEDSTSRGVISAKELYDKFKIKLLDWEYTQPIENSFS